MKNINVAKTIEYLNMFYLESKSREKEISKAIIENFGEYCIGEAEAISQETVCGAYPMGIHPFHSLLIG